LCPTGPSGPVTERLAIFIVAEEGGGEGGVCDSGCDSGYSGNNRRRGMVLFKRGWTHGRDLPGLATRSCTRKAGICTSGQKTAGRRGAVRDSRRIGLAGCLPGTTDVEAFSFNARRELTTGGFATQLGRVGFANQGGRPSGNRIVVRAYAHTTQGGSVGQDFHCGTPGLPNACAAWVSRQYGPSANRSGDESAPVGGGP